MRRLDLAYFPFDPVLLGVDGIDGISHDAGDGFRVESGYYVLDESIVSLVVVRHVFAQFDHYVVDAAVDLVFEFYVSVYDLQNFRYLLIYVVLLVLLDRAPVCCAELVQQVKLVLVVVCELFFDLCVLLLLVVEHLDGLEMPGGELVYLPGQSRTDREEHEESCQKANQQDYCNYRHLGKDDNITWYKTKKPYDSVLRGALTFTLAPRYGLLRSHANVIKILQDDKNFINLHV